MPAYFFSFLSQKKKHCRAAQHAIKEYGDLKKNGLSILSHDDLRLPYCDVYFSLYSCDNCFAQYLCQYLAC